MEHEITLTTLVYGGDALGWLPDPLMGAGARAVFVPFGLPGERVRVKIVEEKRGHARAELIEVLEPSPERIAPRCRHFGECGGCHYQHLPYEKQLEVKTGILRDQLSRIGKIENPPVRPIVASPDQWNYRNYVQFHLDQGGRLGFRAPHSNRIVPISECHLPEDPINALWPQLDFEGGTELERASIRSGTSGDLMLILESVSTPKLETEAGISVVHMKDDDPVMITGSDHIFIHVLDREFRVSAGSFFQVNTAMAEKMAAHLLVNLPVSSSTSLLDVYCGVGLFSAFVASKCGRVIGVESSPRACGDFTVNLDEFENVELYEGTAEAVIPHLAEQPDIILLDPPRAGLGRAVLDGILRLSPQTVAYVSCDPATLARDAKRLIDGGYRLMEVVPFDLFPQTYLIESISLFEKI